MKKLNRKGFTLVELLAVIIILAIVVGITIPAVLTTISSTRDKAFQTAADAAANWFEREYQAWQVGDTTIAKVDAAFTAVCVNGNNLKCTTDTALTDAAIKAAGLKTTDVNASSSKIKIDANTGRACVKLVGKNDGAYQSTATKNGGSC